MVVRYTNYHVVSTLVIFLASIRLASSQCDPTKGCFPEKFDLMENMATFPTRSIEVSSVCDQEQYTSFLGTDTTTYTCDPATLSASNVNDGNPTTYWQSSVGDQPQFLQVNFGDTFLIYEAIINFWVPHMVDESKSADARPNAWTLEKLAEDKVTWQPLRHYAKDCATSFSGIPIFDPFGENAYDVVYCAQYPAVETNNGFFDADNEIFYYPGRMDVHTPFAYRATPAVAKYFATSALRLSFTDLERGVASQKYVAIQKLILDVRCQCHGHADVCSGANGATCECQHSTTGQFCESCLPLYNNDIWKDGVLDNANACQKCSCNAHASACEYNDVKKIGVCQNCQDNTAGDSCDTCATGFYINPTWASEDIQKDGPYCLDCNCNAAGTLADQLTTCAFETGQCACKTNVQGRDCGQCKDTFYGLLVDKPLGCTACACNSAGTVGSDSMCDKTDGSCLCRANVKGATCDSCKADTYGFNANNPDGCLACACDPGASLQQSCNLNTGQCSCRSNIGTRDCKTPNAGYFVPRLDLVILEPEMTSATGLVLRAGHGTTGASSSGRGFVEVTSDSPIQIDFSPNYGGLMDVGVRYEKKSASTLVFLTADITLTSSQSYSCGDVTVDSGEIWTLSRSKVEEQKSGSVILGKACLGNGATYTLKLTNSGAALFIDSIVLVPDLETLKSSVTGPLDSTQVEACKTDALSVLRPNRDSCKALEYSLMAAYMNGAEQCSCTSGSTINSQCDAFSGDCDCKAGVLPPDCGVCRAEYYQFSLQTGCIACGCHEKGSKNAFCGTTGVCECHPNVQGDKCDACAPDHFGLQTGQGCSPCACNAAYSQGSSCDDSGQCVCKPGVGGAKCDTCAHGHFKLTTDGCTSCACDVKGSTGMGCDVITGVCECRDNVEGTACDQCKPGFFGLGEWHPGGCIPCFCWSKGDTCSSAPGLFNNPITVVSGDWPGGWTAADSAGNPLGVVVEGAAPNQKLTVSPLEEAGTDLYFIAPTKFLGDLSSSYGRLISFIVSSTTLPSAADPALLNQNPPVRIVVDSVYSDKALMYEATVQLNVPSQTLEIPVTEASWQIVDKTTLSAGQTPLAPSFDQLMEVLTTVSTLKIRAYDAQTTGHAIVLDSVMVEVASAGPATSVAVNNVEMCQCQQVYGGKHCELCALGHTRQEPSNEDPNSVCVACSCNGHAQQVCDESTGQCTVTPCDPVTGVCVCTHNTEGTHCETCKTGYYGKPTTGTSDDCLPCACPGIVVNNEINAFATSCTQNAQDVPQCVGCATGHTGDRCEICVDGYYGTPEDATNADGKCLACVCNGRADTCDPRTGVCVACRDNTAGQQCEICAPGYFGDAMTNSCQECVCKDYPGSTGGCDPSTGQCVCHPNVEGNVCDQCKPGAFNLQDNIGCELCNCHENGSLSTACATDTGQCTCRSLVTGRQCNACQDSYWNINTITGCDPCGCNEQGSAQKDGAVVTTCDLASGQCTCGLPGTIGRTCDKCSPVTTFTLTYVELFFLGTFPQCELCGECFDSWGVTIDDLGKETKALDDHSREIWQLFDNQTPEEIGESLSVTEEKIQKTSDSIGAFEAIAQDLVKLQDRFGLAKTKDQVLNSQNGVLSDREQALKVQLTALESLTVVIQLTVTTATSVSDLEQKMNSLMSGAQATYSQGGSSWETVQTLEFVVADPVDRERQLRQQADAYMQIATLANQTYQLADIIYKNNLKPGSEDIARELSQAAQQQSDASGKLTSIQTTATQVTARIADIRTAMSTLVEASKQARVDTLKMVDDLQKCVTDGAVVQRDVDDVDALANGFLTETKAAETTMRNSMSTILENLAALATAQTDLATSQVQSTGVLSVSLRPLSSLQQIMSDISSTPISSTDVQAVELKAQEALVVAEEALQETQKALGLAREVNQEVVIMEEDIQASKTLRTETQGLKNAADIIKGEIDVILTDVGAHVDQTAADITSVTSSTQEVLQNVATINTCLDQGEVKVVGASTSASRAEERAQTTSENQQVLLNLMLDINSESGDQAVTQALNSLTEGAVVLDQVVAKRAEVEAITNIEALVQDLVGQSQEITALEGEIDGLTSQLNSLVLSLEENLDGVSCNTAQ